MGFFTARERAALGKSADPRERGAVRELMRQPELAPRRQPANSDVAGHVGTLMQRVSDTSLQRIDDLIAQLQRRREQLLNESARIERAIIEYARLNQTTLQSTRAIAESLAYLHRVPDAPATGERHAEDDAHVEDEAHAEDEPHVTDAPPVMEMAEDTDRGTAAEPSAHAADATPTDGDAQASAEKAEGVVEETRQRNRSMRPARRAAAPSETAAE